MEERREVDVDGRTLLALAGAVAAVVVGTGLARSIPRTLTAMAIATLIALGLNPLVSVTERRLRLPRPAALALIVTGALAAFAALAIVLVPAATRQLRDLDDDVPAAVAELAELPVVGGAIRSQGVPQRIDELVEDLPARLLGEDTPLVRVSRTAADGLVASAITLALAFALLVDGRRLARTAVALLPPRLAPRAERFGDLAYRAIGRYVAGSLTVAMVAGIFVLAVGLSFGVPLAPLLALWVMVWDLVPQIGGAAGGIPFVTFAFTQGAVPGLACAALFIVYLQIENNVLGPLLVGSAIKLSPPATMVAALIGVSAGGVVGALLAVPITGAVKAIYLELRPAGAEPAPEDEVATADP